MFRGSWFYFIKAEWPRGGGIGIATHSLGVAALKRKWLRDAGNGSRRRPQGKAVLGTVAQVVNLVLKTGALHGADEVFERRTEHVVVVVMDGNGEVGVDQAEGLD